MANFHLTIKEDDEMDLVASVEDRCMDSLLSDDVVVEWLLQLEVETRQTGAESAVQEFKQERLLA